MTGFFFTRLLVLNRSRRWGSICTACYRADLPSDGHLRQSAQGPVTRREEKDTPVAGDARVCPAGLPAHLFLSARERFAGRRWGDGVKRRFIPGMLGCVLIIPSVRRPGPPLPSRTPQVSRRKTGIRTKRSSGVRTRGSLYLPHAEGGRRAKRPVFTPLPCLLRRGDLHRSIARPLGSATPHSPSSSGKELARAAQGRSLESTLPLRTCPLP